MGYRAVPLAAALLAVILTLSHGISAATIETKATCPAGEQPKCTVNIDYKSYTEKYAHPNNCDWYFLCSNGAAYCLQCDEGTVYNPETQRCDNTVRVGCIVETTPAPTTTTTTTTPAPTPAPTTPAPTTVPPEDPVPQCPACARDGPTFRHPTNCQWFYECTSGIPVLRQCVGGLHWNARLQVCDYPCLAACSIESQSTPVVNPDGGDTSVCPAGDVPSCPAQDPRMAVLLPNSASPNFYYECSNGIAYCMPCPSGLVFNNELKVCDWPSDVKIPDTEPEPVPVTEPASNDDTKTSCPAAKAPTCAAKDSGNAVLLPHPTSTSFYYECSNGAAICMPCPSGLVFNNNLKVCDWPSSVDDPQPEPVEDTPVEDTPVEDTPVEDTPVKDTPVDKSVCPATTSPACPSQDPKMAVLLAHPTSCEWYFECSNGTPYCMPCPAGEYFNDELKVCDYPENSGCKISS